jgi:hypothetical protein
LSILASLTPNPFSEKDFIMEVVNLPRRGSSVYARSNSDELDDNIGPCTRIIPGSRMLDWFHIEKPVKQRDRVFLETDTEAMTQVLLEIVGAMGLSTKLKVEIDPYCIVSKDEREIHRTKKIVNDANPIWTVETNSLCVVEVGGPNDTFTIRLYDGSTMLGVTNLSSAIAVKSLNGMKLLGTVTLSCEELLRGKGDRKEFVIKPANSNIGMHKGILAMRFRRASRSDLEFLSKIPPQTAGEETGLASDIDFKNVLRNSFFQSTQRKGLKGEFLHRVKPFPDPDCLEETTWMTVESLQKEALKPSTKWVSAGFGSMGVVHLEIIGADNLPKLDINLNDLTDPFVAIAFEDTIVRTDVIWDDLNPRWMPWSTRAFCFHVRHPTSILQLGVFDFDDGPLDYFDPVGRIVINTVNFDSDTTYLLKYNLHHDPRQADDTPRGTLTIRLRIEWDDESEAMKMSFISPPRFIINVETDKAYQVLCYLTRGAVDMEKASVASVKLYANELISYWKSYCYVLDVLFEVVLWRGRLTIGENRTVWFPIHSLFLFTATTIAIERPTWVVPIFLYTISWIMLSINFYASRHPYPWKRVKSCEQTNMVVLLGRSVHAPVKISPNQGVREGDMIERLDDAKAKRMSALISETLFFMVKIYGIYSKTSETSQKITTEKYHWSLLNGRLYYLHILLKSLCTYIRIIRNLVNWKGYISNKLTMNCVLLATIWVVFPVHTFMLWMLRILAWSFLGPWMKAVDVLYVHKWYKTKEELLSEVDGGNDAVTNLPDFDAIIESEIFLNMGKSGRIVAENNLKLKAMREKLFGKYSERIPASDSSRFPSVPLPESTAEPYQGKSWGAPKFWYHVPGQRLTGNMILERSKDHYFDLSSSVV